MSDTTIYTKSETGKKWHIRHGMWTQCYQFCAKWIIADTRPSPDELCKHCQQIAEAIRTGEGVPL